MFVSLHIHKNGKRKQGVDQVDLLFLRYLCQIFKYEMSEIQIKEMNESHKELFNFNGGEAQLNHLKETFTNLIKKSNNDSKDFINFLDFYSKCRPKQHDVLTALIDCIDSCFPEQINEIQQYIQRYTIILKYIMFPEEFPINESKEQKEIFSLLEKDDIDGFISFLSKNPTIDSFTVVFLKVVLFHSLISVVCLVH